MIPSSLLGLALLVVLLAPGLAYVLRHERVVPARSHSAFRESLRVIFVSVACLTATGVLVAGVRWLLPDQTPDIGALVRDPPRYAREHYAQLAWWSLVYVGVATASGAMLADSRIVKALGKVGESKVGRWLAGSTDNRITSVSAWYQVMHLFDEDRPGPINIGAQMNDGTYIEGRLFSFNVASEDDENRDMLLSAPLRLVTVNGKRHDFQAQFTVISARNIVRLDVTHTDPEPESDAPGYGGVAVP